MNEVLATICEQRVVGIVRAADSETAVRAGRRLLRAGLRAVEISLTTPRAVEAIATLREGAPAGAHVGVGTALTPAQVREAAAAGAQFIVSPTFDPHVVAASVELELVSVPGVGTATEAIQARDAGADLLKVFPASTWSPEAVADLLVSLPDLCLVPTGGIDLESAPRWIRAGAIAVGLGSALHHSDLERAGARVRALLAELADTAQRRSHP